MSSEVGEPQLSRLVVGYVRTIPGGRRRGEHSGRISFVTIHFGGIDRTVPFCYSPFIARSRAACSASTRATTSAGSGTTSSSDDALEAALEAGAVKL